MTSFFEAQAVEIAGRLGPSSLQVDAGELLALIGPNGGGKTSLLRACAGIDGTAGTLRIDGEDLLGAPPARRARLAGYLPASRDLVWPIRVRDLIALGLPRPDATRVDELIALLELEALADRPADQLSTGERARALLARVLAPRPRLLLLDEPLSNLDPYWVLRLLSLLRDVAAAGSAVLVSLHDIDRIAAFDRVVLVEGGAIRADLPPDAMIAAPQLSEAFRIQQGPRGWEVRPPADPRSLQ